MPTREAERREPWQTTLAGVLEIVKDGVWMNLPVPTAAGVLDITSLLLIHNCPPAHRVAGMHLVARRNHPPCSLGSGNGQECEVAEIMNQVNGLDGLMTILNGDTATAVHAYVSTLTLPDRILVLALAVVEFRMIDHAFLTPAGWGEAWLDGTGRSWVIRHMALSSINGEGLPKSLAAEFQMRLGDLGRLLRMRKGIFFMGGSNGIDALLGLSPEGISAMLAHIDKETLCQALADPGWAEVKRVFYSRMTKGAVGRAEDAIEVHHFDQGQSSQAQASIIETMIQLDEEYVITIANGPITQPPEAFMAIIERLVLEGDIARFDDIEVRRLLKLVPWRTLAEALPDLGRLVWQCLSRQMAPDTLARLKWDLATTRTWDRPASISSVRKIQEVVLRILGER